MTGGISIKLEQAKAHAETLRLAIQAYVNSNPICIRTRRDATNDELIYYVASIKPIPSVIPATLGDAIQNLRSALDHLAYQLVWTGLNAEPTRAKVYFPIGEDLADFEHRVKSQLKGAASAAVGAIATLEPYKGGKDMFWILHRLSIIDKHRTLLTAGSSYRSVDLGTHISYAMREYMSTLPKWKGRALESPVIPAYFRLKDRHFPLAEGTVLFVDEAKAKPNDKMVFRFDVDIGEEGIITDVPVVEILSDMSSEVENAAQALKAHLH